MSPPAARGEGQAEQTPIPATVSWRLLGSNHRELGRSADLFDDANDCMRAIELLRGSVRHVDSQVLAHSTAGFWYWRIQLESAPVAISSRLYQRRRESVQSLARTLESIPLVDREPVILRVRNGPARGGRVIAGLARAPRAIDLRDSSNTARPTGSPRPHPPLASPTRPNG